MRNDTRYVDIHTSFGVVRGSMIKGGGRFFRGVPYAKALRFRCPMPPDSWKGVRTCNRHTIAAQPVLSLFFSMQDSLQLNIRCPPCSVPAGGLPVMVFFHGGAFMLGSGGDPYIFCKDGGSALVDNENVILVTVNYRLGPLGFLAVRGGDANCGLWDAIASLEWVRNEIAHFGGSPENVTIFGESAGAMICGCLLACPRAQSLFHRAILMSGALSNAIGRIEAEHIADRFATFCGVDNSVDALAHMELQSLLRKQWLFAFGAWPMLPLRVWRNGGCGLMPFQPFVDGFLLPHAPLDAAADGINKEVIVGYNVAEWNLLLPPGPFGFRFPLREAKVSQTLVNNLGPERLNLINPKSVAESIVAAIRAERPGISNGALLMEFWTLHILGVPALDAARALSIGGARVFFYTFACDAGILGPSHAAELPLVFGTWNDNLLWRLFSGSFRRESHVASMAGKMQRWFADFARTGSPGNEWARFHTTKEKSSSLLELEITNWLFGPDVKQGLLDPALRRTSSLYASHSQPETRGRTWGIRAKL